MVQRPDQPEHTAKKGAVLSLEVFLAAAILIAALMPKDRLTKPAASKRAVPESVAMSGDNDWWSWALIVAIFAISAAAVWGPVIAGAI
jgi:hypothetical protein